MVDNPLALETFEKTEEYENVVCAYITGLYDWNQGLKYKDNPYPLMSLEYCSWLDALISVERFKELNE